MHTHRPATWCCCLLLSVLSCSTAAAEIVATGFFSGTIERFDPVTGQQSQLANLSTLGNDPFPGLAGIAFDPNANVLHASANFSNRLYRVDATSGSLLGFTQLDTGSAPAGLALDAAGNLYVANTGGNAVTVWDRSGSLLRTINLPDVGFGDNGPSGLAFDRDGQLVISTSAGPLFRWNPSTDTAVEFALGLQSNSQVAVDASGDIYVGQAATSNDVLKFTADGTPIDSPFLTINEALLPQPPEPYLSRDNTSPSGVAIDADGNLIVAALGRTNPLNPADGSQSNGGLWKFSPDGELLQTFGTAGTLTPLSSVTTITVIPEPGAAAFLAAAGMLLTLRRRRTPTDRRG